MGICTSCNPDSNEDKEQEIAEEATQHVCAVDDNSCGTEGVSGDEAQVEEVTPDTSDSE